MKDRSVLYLSVKPNREKPCHDELARKLRRYWEQRKVCATWKGCHTAEDGMESDNHDYELPGGLRTNSLCLHYLIHHRSSVPADELELLEKLPDDPTFNPTTLWDDPEEPFTLAGHPQVDWGTLQCLKSNLNTLAANRKVCPDAARAPRSERRAQVMQFITRWRESSNQHQVPVAMSLSQICNQINAAFTAEASMPSA